MKQAFGMMAEDDDSTNLKFPTDDYDELKSTYTYLKSQARELKRRLKPSDQKVEENPLSELIPLVRHGETGKRKREGVEDDGNEKKKSKTPHRVPPLPPEMWEKICNYSKLAELKKLRLVNSVLERVASDSIKRSHSRTIIVKLCFNEKRWKYIHCTNDPIYHRHKGRNKSMDDLMRCLVKCKNHNFPCSSFSFIGGNLGSVAHFFEQYGQLIKSLELKFDNGSMAKEKELGVTKKSTFFTILRGPLLSTSLESLAVNDIYCLKDDPTVQNEETDQLTLPSLRYFESAGYIVSGLKCVNEIVAAAPHLETFVTPDFGSSSYIQLFLDTYKLHTLKKLRMLIRDHHDITRYEELVSFSVHPQLESMDIEFTAIESQPEMFSRVSKALSKLLESSRRTLKNMKIKYAIGFLTDIVWPRLKHLRHLTIDFQRIRTIGVYNWIMPPDIDWAQCLPCLQTMTFIFSRYHDGDKNFVEDFPIAGQIASVKTLCIVCLLAFPKNWFQHIGLLFPNLEQLVIGSEADKLTVQDFASSAPNIWNNFKGLKYLKLTLTIRMESAQNPYLLDPVFTGLTKETCTVLREFGHIFSKTDLRINPSILNLKELKTLDLTFLKYYGERFVLMSSVSDQYAFKCLPNLDDVRLKLYLTKPTYVSLDLNRNQFISRARRSLKSVDPCFNIQLLIP